MLVDKKKFKVNKNLFLFIFLVLTCFKGGENVSQSERWYSSPILRGKLSDLKGALAQICEKFLTLIYLKNKE